MFSHVSKIIGSGVVYRLKQEQQFFDAVIAGDLNQIGKLIKKGVNPNALDNEAFTALHIAAEKGDVEVGKYLLSQKNIDVNAHANTRHGECPLLTAVIFNRVQFVSLLLQHGANPNIKNIFGRAALHAAVKTRNLAMVKTLLVWKAQPNIMDAFGSTPLSLSVIDYPSHKIAEILLTWNADPNFRTTRAHPLLLELALNCRFNEDLRMVKLLVDYKADVNIENLISRQTALHLVSITGYVPLAKLLLQYGANQNLRDLIGRTPYDMAIEHNQLSLISFYKKRERMLKDIIKDLSLGDDKPQLTSVHSNIGKKKISPSVPRTVRFSEIQSTESDDELYLQHV